MCFASASGCVGHRILEQIAALHRLNVDRKALRAEPLKLEKIFNQCLHPRRRSPDELHGLTQCAVALVFGLRQVPQEVSGFEQNHGERVPEVVGHDREHLIARAHGALFAKKTTLDVHFRGAPLQLVGGLEIARRPRTERARTSSFHSANEWRGRRRLPASASTGLVGSPPQFTVWMTSGRNHISRAPGSANVSRPLATSLAASAGGKWTPRKRKRTA